MERVDKNVYKPLLSGQVYDILKHVVQLWLPALAAAYFSLASIWGLPASEEIVGTSAVLATLLGALLRVSSNQYTQSGIGIDGDMTVYVGTDNQTKYMFDLPEHPEALQNKNQITFKVVREDT